MYQIYYRLIQAGMSSADVLALINRNEMFWSLTAIGVFPQIYTGVNDDMKSNRLVSEADAFLVLAIV